MGEDIWSQVFPAYLENLRQDPDPDWTVHLIETLG